MEDTETITTTIGGIDITPFLSDGPTRYASDKPFVIRGWKYATDGEAIIAMPTDDNDSPGTVPPANELDWSAHDNAEWHSPTESNEQIGGDGPCDQCGGETVVDGKMCDVCMGYGEHECNECGQNTDCKHCDGRGRKGGRWCETCDRTGQRWYEDRYRRLSGILVKTRYYHAVMSIPGVEIALHPEHPETHAIAFRNAYVKGFVMPINEEAVKFNQGR